MRLRDLDLLPMKVRFLTADLMLFYDIYNDLSCVKLPEYLKPFSQEERRRLRPIIKPPEIFAGKETLSLQKMRESKNDCYSLKSEIEAKSSAFKSSFFFRTVQEWNSLPSEIKEAPNKTAFRESLLEHTKNNTFKFDILDIE